MSNSITVSPGKVEAAANLLFSIFIYISDVDESMNARDVQNLNEMLKDTNWCDNSLIKAGLDELGTRYGEMWKAYQKKNFLRELRSLTELRDALLAGIPDPENTLVAIRVFLDRLSVNSTPALVRLGIKSMPAAKRTACREVESILSALEYRKSETTSGAQPKPAQTQESAAAAPEIVQADLSIWPAATMALGSDNLWKRGRTPVHCIAVIPETQDVNTFVFQALIPVLFAYKPGQFVTLELPIEGKTVRRSYTISSSPSRPHTISITVKRVPGGLVSNWLHDNMQVGFQLALSGPHGEFTCFDAPAEKLLLISAGSGITPVMSMLRWLVDTSTNANIVFLNNIRTPADVIFADELKYLGMRFGERLKLGLIPGKVHSGQSWNGPTCHFSEHVVRMWAPDFVEREVFVCGPPGYMDAVRTTLERMGHPPHRYHQESFGGPPAAQKGSVAASAPAAAPTQATVVPAPAPVAVAKVAQIPVAAPQTPADSEETTVELVFSLSSKTVKTTSAEFILDVAEQHGIKLESSCRAGNCGTCKIRKVEGTVEMEGQQALGEADLEEGYVLACIGRACSSRVVLEA